MDWQNVMSRHVCALSQYKTLIGQHSCKSSIEWNDFCCSRHAWTQIGECPLSRYQLAQFMVYRAHKYCCLYVGLCTFNLCNCESGRTYCR